jgi:hypothetical protein
MKKIMFIAMLLMFVSCSVAAKGNDVKIKFYNFDDLLIDGKVKKPQVLYTDARQKVKFNRLLKLKKDLIPRLKGTKKDATLR